MELRRRRAAALRVLADDLDYLKVDTEWCKNEIGRLKDLASSVAFMTSTTIPAAARPLSLADEEEGRPLVGGGFPEMEDDRVTLYESTHSASWNEVLWRATQSVRSSLAGGGGDGGGGSKP
jgi:hypothetical protein